MPFLPKEAADSCLRRARRFLKLANAPLAVSQSRNDLKRMALVMTVAAVDSYMHGVVLRRVARVRRRDDLPAPLARLDLPFAEIGNLADAALDARRKGTKARPWVQVKAALQRRLLKETFQSFDQVGRAFAIAGVEKAWSRVAEILEEPSEHIKCRLDSLVHRRNQIVHEGDLMRASRPRGLKFNAIRNVYVKQEVDWVETLIMVMEIVVEEP